MNYIFMVCFLFTWCGCPDLFCGDTPSPPTSKPRNGHADGVGRSPMRMRLIFYGHSPGAKAVLGFAGESPGMGVSLFVFTPNPGQLIQTNLFRRTKNRIGSNSFGRRRLGER